MSRWLLRRKAGPNTPRLSLRLVCLAAIAAVAGAGCSRSGEADGSRPPRSPRETISRLIAARDQRQYQIMRELIVPQRAHEVVTTLAAVDDFLSANDQLCELIRTEVGLGAADAVDQGQLAYHLDVFSRCVTLLDESITGDEAQVAFLVDERLPARHAHLRRLAGNWRYDPGSGEFGQLGAAFERMAYGLRQVLDGLHRGQLSTARFRQNPQDLMDEVRLRLLPGVKLLPQGPTQPTGAGRD